MDTNWLRDTGIALDREAEVPVGLQLTWALRCAIATGQLSPGERLPGARELADAVGVNVNTLRTVIARLEDEGFLKACHGTGTFVADRAPRRDNLAVLVDEVSQAARRAGVDPRDLAGALYGAEGRPTPDADAGERRELRQQIALLDRLHAELARTRGEGLGTLSAQDAAKPTAARLLSLEELRAQRDGLLDSIQRLREDGAPAPSEPPPVALAPERTRRRETTVTRPRAQPA